MSVGRNKERLAIPIVHSYAPVSLVIVSHPILPDGVTCVDSNIDNLQSCVDVFMANQATWLCIIFSQSYMLVSTLPLYTHISSFLMISNIRVTFSSIIRLGPYCRMCFEPLAIYAMSFRPFPMFARLYLTYRYINGLSMHSPYYSIPIRHVPDLLRLCFDFIYLWRYQYSDVSIIYSFGWLYYYYRFGDEHTTALYAYFVDFDDFQYSRDLRQHYTTQTML